MSAFSLWSEQEDTLLRKLYIDDGLTVSKCAEALKRPFSGTKSRLNELGIKRKIAAIQWTPEEDEAIRRGVAAGMTNSKIATQINRSTGGVCHRRRYLGVKMKFSREWTPQEEETLRNLVEIKTPVIKIAQQLNRTRGSVIGRMSTLGLRIHRDTKREFWTEAEVQILKDMLADGATQEQIGARVGRSAGAVGMIKGKLGLRQKMESRVKNLSPEQIQRIIQMYVDEERTSVICEENDIDSNVLYYLVKKYGIPKRRALPNPKAWKNEEYKMLVELLDLGLSVPEIQAKMDRTPSAIMCAARKLGVRGNYQALRDQRNADKRKSTDTLPGRFSYTVTVARQRCEKQGWRFELTVQDITAQYEAQGGKCFYTGKPLSCITHDPLVMSIDRIDSDLGYIKGNVVLATWIANFSKQDLTVNECHKDQSRGRSSISFEVGCT